MFSTNIQNKLWKKGGLNNLISFCFLILFLNPKADPDLAAKGFNHVKAVDCGIRISETFFNSFKSAWSDDLVNRYSGGKYAKFSDNFEAGDHKATGRYKGYICYEASAVEGLTIFWKKTDDPSFTGGYY